MHALNDGCFRTNLFGDIANFSVKNFCQSKTSRNVLGPLWWKRKEEEETRSGRNQARECLSGTLQECVQYFLSSSDRGIRSEEYFFWAKKMVLRTEETIRAATKCLVNRAHEAEQVLGF